MPESIRLTEAMIRSESSVQSFERGREYYREGAIFNPARQGNTLLGECEGSSAPAYRLRVELNEGGIYTASCTCPYDWGGFCKHIVALLLAFVHEPEAFTERKDVVDLTSDLDRDELVNLIAKLVDRHPDLYDWLEISAARGSTKTGKGQSKEGRKSQIPDQVYRRQVKHILHSLDGYRMSEAYWMMGGMVQQLVQVRDSALQYLEAGDAEEALAILMAELEEVADSFGQFDDSNGELGGFLSELGEPLAEAILSADLTEEERDDFSSRLSPIVSELSDYGIEGLELALIALEQGWEGTETVVHDEKVGEDEEEWEKESEEEWIDEDELTQSKLNVLDRLGRVDDYLTLCRQAGEHRRYILKLLELGRKEEAMQTALNQIGSAEDALSVAQSLYNLGYISDALAVGERGLSLIGHKHVLGVWLGPLEESQGCPETALQAYMTAFAGTPSLELYLAMQRLAGSQWEPFKKQLLGTLRSSSGVDDVLVDVYLFEEDWDSAVQLTEQFSWNYALLEKVADAVISYRPDWVIQISRKEAEGLIDKTQSKYYQYAARWLMKMKQAYIQSERRAEWLDYLDRLKTTYARRPALQAELRRL